MNIKNDDEQQIEPEFEVISNPQGNMFSLENVQNMVELTCQLATEKGLDQQGFLCDECAHPIGIDFSEPRYILRSNLFNSVSSMTIFFL